MMKKSTRFGIMVWIGVAGMLALSAAFAFLPDRWNLVALVLIVVSMGLVAGRLRMFRCHHCGEPLGEGPARFCGLSLGYYSVPAVGRECRFCGAKVNENEELPNQPSEATR